MVDKFRGISTVMIDIGHEPLRLLTDVTGEPFWTAAGVESIELRAEVLTTLASLVFHRSAPSYEKRR
jgi:hypothetical protein